MTDITPIDPQELLNKNWEWFSADPARRATVWKAQGGGNRGFYRCQYRVTDPRDPRGWRGCAIGNWMPDEVYEPRMEQDILLEGGEAGSLEPTASNVKWNFVKATQWLQLCDDEFLDDVQQAHDECLSGDLRRFREEISSIAWKYNLKDPTEGG